MTLSELESLMRKTISKNFPEDAHLFSITEPPSHIKADASTNFAIIVAKKNGIKIADVYKKISDNFDTLGISTELAGGFINIYFGKNIYANYISGILSSSSPFIKNENTDKKVIIEFVSANPTGPLHLASAISASLGDSISSIMKELGYTVFKEYYVNDAGNQVEMLGRSLLSRYTNTPLPEDGYHGEYLIEIAKKLPDVAAEWAKNNDIKKFSDFALKEILEQQKKDLEDFGLTFDNWFFESELHKKGISDETLKLLEDRGAVEYRDGAKWLKSADNLIDKENVLVKSNGLKTYFLNDLAYHRTKYERGFNWIIDIWGADHHGHISRMKSGVKMLGFDETKFTVILHQLISIKRGSEILKMSKRSGTFYTLREMMEETSKDAIRFFFTMRSPDTHIIFDIDLAKKQTSENPLYYVQYAHSRINSVIENAKAKGFDTDISELSKYELSDDDRIIFKKLFWFEKSLNQCVKDLSPHHLTTYLIELAKEFHSYYERNRVIDETNPDTTLARITILKAIKFTIKKGLDLLGVSAPERM